MDWNNRVKEALVGGGAGLFVVASYIVSRAALAGTDDGDWLNFAGIIFGVAFTIGGTIAVDSLRTHLRRRRHVHDLVGFLTILSGVLVISHNDQFPVVADRVRGIIPVVRAAIERVGFTDHQQELALQTIRDLMKSIEGCVDTFERENWSDDEVGKILADMAHRVDIACLWLTQPLAIREMRKRDEQKIAHATSPENSPSSSSADAGTS